MAVAVCSTSLRGQEFVWTQSILAPSTAWRSVASSSDGTILVAGFGASGWGSGVSASTNSGLTWEIASTPTNGSWFFVASSSDGLKMVAVAYHGGIFASTNSGATWIQSSAPSVKWRSVASSFDGSKLVAADYGGGIYTSTNSGETWMPRSAPSKTWFSVASSSDGNKLVAVSWATSGGVIFTSTNSGATWISNNVPKLEWYSVASSSDGTKLVAAVVNGGIFTSTNSGTTWIQSSAPIMRWYSVASSADGTKLVAADNGGGNQIYTSTNSGLMWINSGAPSRSWWSVASSSDGTKLVAVDDQGFIYTACIKKYPPSIAQQPGNLASCPSRSAVLGVSVTGTPPFDYQWRKNGTNLVDGGNVTGSTTNRLTLLNLSQSDSANYDVVITNIVGSVTSSVAILIVGSAPAKATPVFFNGFIVGGILTDGGCGYTNSPIIVFSGQGGSGAAGYGQISDGSVTNIVITSAGFGYPSNTVAQVAPPFFPTMSIALTNTPAATATPVIINGFVVGANLTASGSAYTIPPVITFSDVTGNGATGYTQISNGLVTNLVITSAGSTYSSNTVIIIPPAAYQNAVIPSANSLMLGQTFQLQIANAFGNWTNYGSTFFATNNAWASPDYWVVANAYQIFFRLRMLP